MRNDEQARVLNLIAEGKLTPEQGAELLDALEPDPVPAGSPPPRQDFSAVEMRSAPLASRRSHSLVIQVTESGESRVNIRIPLGLARAAAHFIPRRAHEYLERYEIDLTELLTGGGTEAHGSLIEVRDDEDTVRIAVE